VKGLYLLVYAVIEFGGQVRTNMQLYFSFAKSLGEGRAWKIAFLPCREIHEGTRPLMPKEIHFVQ
jgi:hypothetical protein